jgi:tetratricopeptide (TPR) repeat protein
MKRINKQSSPAASSRPAAASAVKLSEIGTPASQKTVRLAAILCALLAFVLYANTLGHDYTVDDGTVISNNTITKKGISALPEIFTTAYRAGFWDRNEGLYRPLSVAMFAIEWELAPENPALGHWINVILYSLTAFMLLLTLAAVFREYSLLFPLTATLLFVVHPVHTEVVANIKSRDEILFLLFTIVSLFNLHRYLNNGKWLALLVAAVSYFLAFLSKESAITFIGVVPFFIWFFHDKKPAEMARITAVFAAVGVVYMMMRYSVLGEFKGSPLLQLVNNSLLATDSGVDRFATAMYIMGKYLYLLVIPHPLAFDYSYNTIPVVSLSNMGALVSVVVYAALIWIAFKGLIRKDPLSFFILFFFATISLVSNVLFLIESTMAERFLYMPSIGFVLAIAFIVLKQFRLLKYNGGDRLASYFSVKPAFTVIMVLALTLYSVKTISRNSDWKDNLTLLEKDVKTCPESARIRYAYGSALLIEKALKEENESVKQALLDKSIVQLEKGVTILPNYAEAWNHLGIAYKEKKNFAAAVKAFEQARSFKEFKEADFYISAGLAYGEMKMFDLAIADFTKAILIDPANAEAYNNKGLYLFEKGVADSSVFYFDQAISLKPGFYQAYYNKGNTLAAAGRFTEAIQLYNESLKHKPDYVDAWLNIGNSYAAMKDYAGAMSYYQKVEQAEPGNRKVLVNIGITYRFMGDEAKALEYFAKAEKIK